MTSPRLRRSVAKEKFTVRQPILPALPISPGFFRAHVWDVFDVRSALEVLLDERKSYLGHKVVLEGGLRGWCLFSKTYIKKKKGRTDRAAVERARHTFIRDMMSGRIMRQVARGEVAMSQADDLSGLVDRFARAMRRRYWLYREIYLPTGGARVHANAPSKSSLKKAIVRSTSPVPLVIAAMKFLHAFADAPSRSQLARKLLTKADIQRALEHAPNETWMELAHSRSSTSSKSREKTKMATSTFYTAWKDVGDALPFLYAAWIVPYQGRTLLDQLTEPVGSLDAATLNHWISTTRFVCNKILPHFDPALGERVIAIVPEGPEATPEPPVLAANEAAAFAKVFKFSA